VRAEDDADEPAIAFRDEVRVGKLLELVQQSVLDVAAVRFDGQPGGVPELMQRGNVLRTHRADVNIRYPV